MKRTLSLLAAACVLLSAFVVEAAKPGGGGGGGGTSSPNFRYTLVLLGSLGATIDSEAYGINEAGDIVGRSVSADGRHYSGFIVFAGTTEMVDVNTLIPPGSGWTVYGVAEINDGLQMVGGGRWRSADGLTTKTGSLRLIPNSATGYWDIEPFEDGSLISTINQDGDVVGSQIVLDSDGVERYHAVLWTAEGLRVDLGTLLGQNTGASDLTDRINGQIQIVGSIDSYDTFGWKTTYTIGDLSAAPLQNLGYAYQDTRTQGYSLARGINNLGQIVGETTFAKEDAFAARYSNGTWQKLGTLNPNVKNGSWNNSWANDINGDGYVIGHSMVGSSSSTPNIQPFLYHDTFKMVNLDGLIDALPTSLLGALEPRQINNANVIVGRAGGVQQAFVLVPHPK